MKIFIKRRSIYLSAGKLTGNERGFAFPVTLCILMLFTIVLSFKASQLVIEKRFYKEIEQFEKNQFYFLTAIKKTEEYLSSSGEDYEKAGVFEFKDCTVSYHITQAESELLHITYSFILPGRAEVNGIAYYDRQIKKIVNWHEKG